MLSLRQKVNSFPQYALGPKCAEGSCRRSLKLKTERVNNGMKVLGQTLMYAKAMSTNYLLVVWPPQLESLNKVPEMQNP